MTGHGVRDSEMLARRKGNGKVRVAKLPVAHGPEPNTSAQRIKTTTLTLTRVDGINSYGRPVLGLTHLCFDLFVLKCYLHRKFSKNT
jgi:hypothetical protein